MKILRRLLEGTGPTCEEVATFSDYYKLVMARCVHFASLTRDNDPSKRDVIHGHLAIETHYDCLVAKALNNERIEVKELKLFFTYEWALKEEQRVKVNQWAIAATRAFQNAQLLLPSIRNIEGGKAIGDLQPLKDDVVGEPEPSASSSTSSSVVTLLPSSSKTMPTPTKKETKEIVKKGEASAGILKFFHGKRKAGASF
jgi:hypothetical protein